MRRQQKSVRGCLPVARASPTGRDAGSENQIPALTDLAGEAILKLKTISIRITGAAGRVVDVVPVRQQREKRFVPGMAGSASAQDFLGKMAMKPAATELALRLAM